MSISTFQIRRWIKMLSDRSIDHVNQDKGKCFSATEIKCYYNNLTEKVTKQPVLLDSDKLPMIYPQNQYPTYFPVAIFQYGLGAYDLFLQSNDEKYLKKFFQCVDWAVTNIDDQDRWNNFFFYTPDTPYGAMAQREPLFLSERIDIQGSKNI